MVEIVKTNAIKKSVNAVTVELASAAGEIMLAMVALLQMGIPIPLNVMRTIKS